MVSLLEALGKLTILAFLAAVVFLNNYPVSADQAVLHANTTNVNTTNGTATRSSWTTSDWLGEIGTELTAADYLAAGRTDNLRAYQPGINLYDPYIRANWTKAMPGNILSINWIYACTAFNKTGTKDSKKFAIWNYTLSGWTEISDGGAASAEWFFCFNVTGSNITHFVGSGNKFVTISRTYGTNAEGLYLNTMNMTLDYTPTDTLRPDIFVQSPANTTYLSKTIDLNVSANEPIDTWKYSINGTANVTFTPNITITVSAGPNNITVYGNDTVGNINSTTVYFTLNTTLEANLSEPTADYTTNIVQNTTFAVNATLFCRQGDCGNVAGTLLYNGTSSNPDTPVSITAGAEPFYISEMSPASTKSCTSNPLLEGVFCNLTWNVNATDSGLGSWKFGVNFSSDSGWTAPNTTSYATVSVDYCFVDITFHWSSIDFENPLAPNTYENPALGNVGDEYNITINPGSCNTDLYIKGTNMENSTLSYSLGAGNLTWSNTSNLYSSSFNMTQSYKPVKLNVAPLTNITTWYWLNVPPIFAANYNGTVYLQGVKSGSAPP